MVEIQLRSDCLFTDTIVPNKFIDQYMVNANGEFVKVYLYLLRSIHSNAHNCSISAIADFLNHTEADVTRALLFWEKEGLLCLKRNETNQVCRIQILSLDTDCPAKETNSQTISSVSQTAMTYPAVAPVTAPTELTKHAYTADEITQFCRNADISELFFVVETYLKHPLSSQDMNTILFWHDQLAFPTELIIYLLEYCISKGHSSLRYMDKVAISWHDNHITTVEQAKEETSCHSQAYYRIMKAFGISGRNLAESEHAYLKKWTSDYAFDLSLIELACARTMTNIHQPSFEYTDTILTSWYKNHVHTVEDVNKLDQMHAKTRRVTIQTDDTPTRRNAFTNFNQRDYDYDKLEELLLTNPIQ